MFYLSIGLFWAYTSILSIYIAIIVVLVWIMSLDDGNSTLNIIEISSILALFIIPLIFTGSHIGSPWFVLSFLSVFT